jgi:hypothetical protein
MRGTCLREAEAASLRRRQASPRKTPKKKYNPRYFCALAGKGGVTPTIWSSCWCSASICW